MSNWRTYINKLHARIEDPLVLAFTSFVFAVLLWILGKVLALLFPEMADPYYPWMISAAIILFYALFCSLLLFKTKKLIWYWSRSIYGLIGLVMLNALFAYFLSGTSIYQAESYRTVFIILIIAFIVFMTIVSSVKKVVEYTVMRDRKKMDKENKKP